jgi:hypothetical protein
MHDEYDIPPTEAELALDDPLIAWDRGMPREQPKRKPTSQLTLADIDAHVAAAIEDHKALMMEVMGQALGVIQSRLKQRLNTLETEVANLRTELEVQKRVNARMMQVDQREQRHVINGHA